MLIRGERESRGIVGHRSRHEAAIIAPGERDVWLDFLQSVQLILHVSGLLEGLIVVDAEDRIVWVAGHALDEAFRVTDPAQAVIILRLKAVGGPV